MYTYNEGTVVNLTAEAEDNYRFVNWTGDVGTIDNVEASNTTITITGDYEIVAVFETTESPCDYECHADCQAATPVGWL